MLFNSFQFLFFFVLVTGWYYTLPHRWRWLLLLLVSAYFYMAFVPVYIVILIVTIVIDYIAGISLEQSSPQYRPYILTVSIIANVSLLAIFKYYSFFQQNLQQLSLFLHFENPLPYWSLLLPIGLSFHTFQAMSYTIEVYRGKQKAERHFGIYALYVLFYPQLVAGPIERPQNLLPQFHEPHRFDRQLFQSGLWLMAIGFFKKMVIADRLALLVNAAYSQPNQQNGLTLLIATIFFAFQIYCDFSGYSSIAIGAARTMGFRLMNNFNAPYWASDLSDFWRRWHISLSTWFRDYVYIPLGGSRQPHNLVRNICIVFLLSGFWHGANWTFIAWGLVHACCLVLQLRYTRLSRWRPPLSLQIALTFFIVCISWVFFRANNLHEAGIIFQKIAQIDLTQNLQIPYTNREWLFCWLLIIGLMLVEKYKPLHQPPKSIPLFVLILSFLVLSCYWFGEFDNQQFIYFQF